MGSLRDLKRGDGQSESGSDKTLLFTRLQELVAEHGKSWGKIASIIEEEGFRAGGEVITANALRKGYTRWTEAERAASPNRRPTQPDAVQPASPVPPVGSWQGMIMREMDQTRAEMMLLRQRLKEAESIPSQISSVLVPQEGIGSPMEELISLNNQLVEQLRESNVLMKRLEQRLEEQETKTRHTDIDTEQHVTSKDLLELLKEVSTGRLQMMHIEEERKDYVVREEVHQLLEETVEAKVEAELKTMLSPDGSFSKEFTHLIDHRLKTLFSGGEPVVKTSHAGPGRGKKGKTHKKFSASLEENLFNRVKDLPGQFSGHLSNALEAYLSVMEEKKED